MPSPTTFYFVRHGESEGNAARVFTGQTDSPLTARGRQQAAAVADELANVKFDRIISSDLSRTRDTAEVIAKRHGLSVEVMPALREINVGDRTGKTFDETRGLPNWSDDGFVVWPGGESLDQVLARALGAIDRLTRESPGKTILIVGHGGVNRIVLSHFLGKQHHAVCDLTRIEADVVNNLAFRTKAAKNSIIADARESL